KWAPPVKIGKEIISKDYVNHISITEDGKTIYLAAEKPGGSGKLDIYRTEMQKDGSWSNVDNLGNAINTAGNEQSPFISRDGKELYYSSDGMDGYGGYDIFKTTYDGKKWSKPENLGIPYNSVGDDIF